MIEIEKTFLVKKIPINISQYQSQKIKQGYLSPGPSPLRIRQKGDKYELTKKIPLKNDDNISVEEINILLTEYEFDKLWPLIERSLEKTRYLIPLNNGLTAELDIYSGPLKGLCVVEVEFPSTENMNSFVSPEWFGKDITQIDSLSNSHLAGKNFADIKPYL
jgi:adenylate cyclase